MDTMDIELSEGSPTLLRKHPPRRKIFIVKGSADSLGFTLRGERDDYQHFISKVTEGGVAEKAGLLVGDKLLEVNSENVEMVPHKEVIEKILENSSELILVVRESDMYLEKKKEKREK